MPQKNIVYIRLQENFEGLNLNPQSSNENKKPLLILDHDQMGHMKESYIVENKWFLLKVYKTACFSCLLSSDAGRHAIGH